MSQSKNKPVSRNFKAGTLDDQMWTVRRKLYAIYGPIADDPMFLDLAFNDFDWFCEHNISRAWEKRDVSFFEKLTKIVSKIRDFEEAGTVDKIARLFLNEAWEDLQKGEEKITKRNQERRAKELWAKHRIQQRNSAAYQPSVDELEREIERLPMQKWDKLRKEESFDTLPEDRGRPKKIC